MIRLWIMITFILMGPAFAQDHWVITQKDTGFSYDTQTQKGSRNGISRKGLISVSKSGGNVMQSYWQPSAYRATMIFNGVVKVDGYDTNDISRIGSFRFDKTGSTVYIRTTKGPKAIVELYQDGEPVLNWPRLSLVNILSYQKRKLYLSHYVDATQTTEFWVYPRNASGALQTEGRKVGQLAGCALLGSKVIKKGIAIEAYCDQDRGSDVKFLSFNTGEIRDVLATTDDEILAFSHKKHNRGEVAVLSISGNNNARQFYHAITGSMMKMLGEPMAYASDEGGKQSWSQSYRTRTLAVLYEKTRHPVFSRLTSDAMTSILDQTNKQLAIEGVYNPSCAWASRIYSKDGRTALSFMINQAMIASSLSDSCTRLGGQCSPALKARIAENNRCLVDSYEQWFDEETALYRIPYGANFRYDGIWAPWNWHMMWAGVLNHDPRLKYQRRARYLIKKFVQSWQVGNDGLLWRYWPAPYYQGWDAEDLISKSRPQQKARNMSRERYEDLNHAGISLLGITSAGFDLPDSLIKQGQRTLDRLLAQGAILARDMDGKGPVSPRWLPGAGWHLFETQKLADLYAHKLPGGVSSDQHLAYALMYQAGKKFDLKMTFSSCALSGCQMKEQQHFSSADAFLNDNPLFQISPSQNGFHNEKLFRTPK